MIPTATRLVVDLHPGSSARVYCDGDPGQVPILVIADGTAEVLLSPAGDAASAVDVTFTEELLHALGTYLARLRWLAAC